MEIEQIKVGSWWRRLLNREVWQVSEINPNGTVTVQARNRPSATFDIAFFLGAFSPEL